MSGGDREVIVDIRDGVAWVTLNRPHRLNAMDDRLMDLLVEDLRKVARDGDVRCVVLTGAGRGFCAGGDVRMMRDRREASREASVGAQASAEVALIDQRAESVALLYEMPKPTIAMINGAAVGGGLALALACDVRLALAGAKLGVGFLSRAVSGTFGISYLLVDVIGAAKARELCFYRDTVDAEEALALGLVTNVCRPPEALLAETERLAAALGSGPTLAYAKIKENIGRAAGRNIRELMHLEAVNSRMSSLSNDAREAATAFVEKRSPRFTGR